MNFSNMSPAFGIGSFGSKMNQMSPPQPQGTPNKEKGKPVKGKKDKSPGKKGDTSKFSKMGKQSVRNRRTKSIGKQVSQML